jgi:hypothetical protein
VINGALPKGVRGMALTSLTCTGGGTTPWAARAERISPASLDSSTFCGWASRTSSPSPSLLDLPTRRLHVVHEVMEDTRLHGPDSTASGRESERFLFSSLDSGDQRVRAATPAVLPGCDLQAVAHLIPD